MTEAEETIESGIVAVMKAAVSLPVIGFLAPAEPGTQKMDYDSRIGVKVDLQSQDGDWIGAPCPCTWTAEISVRVAQSEDPSGTLFREACRSVRAALQCFLGDNCSALSSGSFACDAVLFAGTLTDFMDDAEVGAFVKTYTMTIYGRVIPE